MTAEREREPKTIKVYRCIIFDGDNNVLLVQRARDDRWNPGMWELPGGKREPGQDRPTALAEEVFQETGLRIQPTRDAIHTEVIKLTRGPWAGRNYKLTVFTARHPNGEVILSHEHSNFSWVTVKEALKMQTTQQTHGALVLFAYSQSGKPVYP